MQLPFGRTRSLETQVDAFLDVALKAHLSLREGLHAYLRWDQESFQAHMAQVAAFENEADHFSRSIETALYTYSLIPESRGDVLEILERTDTIIDQAKGVIGKFDVERPDIPDPHRENFGNLTDVSVKSVEHLVQAARGYFRDPGILQHEIAKVEFYEKEADRVGLALKKAIFQSELDLSRKQHLRYFVEAIESLSDLAEDVGNVLAIAAIKRSV